MARTLATRVSLKVVILYVDIYTCDDTENDKLFFSKRVDKSKFEEYRAEKKTVLGCVSVCAAYRTFVKKVKSFALDSY